MDQNGILLIKFQSTFVELTIGPFIEEIKGEALFIEGFECREGPISGAVCRFLNVQ